MNRPSALVVLVIAGLVIGALAVAALATRPATDGPAGEGGSPGPAAAPDPGGTAQPGAAGTGEPDGDTGQATPATPGTTPAAGQPTGEPGDPTPIPRPRGKLNVSTADWTTNFDIGNVDLSEIISGGPGKDGIPAIDEPKFESIADAQTWLDDRAPVIALEINGAARAYPIAILIWHEIANDTLGGVPVVVTFCPLCNTALVFERELDGVVYDFGTTGNLRFSDLVMYDRQTESWWQQATGEAIVGVLTGTRLTFVPSQILALEDFAANYPEGDVLSRDTGHQRQYGRNPYVGYDTVDQQPFLFRGEVDGRLPPMERVVTVNQGGEAAAYPYSELEKVGVVNDRVGEQDIVVFWEAGVSSALDAPDIDQGRDVGGTGVFDPQLDGTQLSFERREGTIVDRETGSTWNITGQATDGELAGERLERVGHADHFWFAWAAFEPETRIWTVGD